jgi:GcrA cell cycle regulator
MSTAYSSWTSPRVERLKTLAECMTAGQIAREFGDISRSAVYAKLRLLQRGPLPETGPWSRIERIEELKELNAQGLSSQQIAERFGDVSRSAVLGKLFRLRLPSRPLTPARRGPQMRTLKPRVALAPLLEAPPPIGAYQGPLNITIYALTSSTCRWPTNDTKPVLYCGRAVYLKSSYCRFHDNLSRKVDRR